MTTVKQLILRHKKGENQGSNVDQEMQKNNKV